MQPVKSAANHRTGAAAVRRYLWPQVRQLTTAAIRGCPIANGLRGCPTANGLRRCPIAHGSRDCPIANGPTGPASRDQSQSQGCRWLCRRLARLTLRTFRRARCPPPLDQQSRSFAFMIPQRKRRCPMDLLYASHQGEKSVRQVVVPGLPITRLRMIPGVQSHIRERAACVTIADTPVRIDDLTPMISTERPGVRRGGLR